MDQGVTFLGVEAPRQIIEGQPLEVVVHFQVRGPTDRAYELFVHAVHRGGDRSCSLGRDVQLEAGASNTWQASGITQRVRLGDARRCGDGVLDIYLGLFDPETGERLAVLDNAGWFDRIHAAQTAVLRAGADALPAPVMQRPIVDPPPSARLEAPKPVTALALVAGAVVLGLLLAWWRARWAGFRLAVVCGRTGPLCRAAAAIPLALVVAGVLFCLGFVKDDAYISFRYAHNLVHGQGLVFNPGERVEGYTNFLWTLLLAPLEAAGADLIQVCDILGPILAMLLLVTAIEASLRLDGRGPWCSHVWGATWLASSSSLALWAVGGLEQSLAALLPLAGCLVTWQGWHAADARRSAAGAALLAAGCLTRPEGHVFVIASGILVLGAALRGRSRAGSRVPLVWTATVAAFLVPYHLFRLTYYRSLLPNTYLVKAVSGVEVWRAGLQLLGDLLRFNWTGVVVALAVASALIAGHRVLRLASIAVAVVFLAYVVKVGTDELMWHRLFLPALPFAAIAAGSALRLAADLLARAIGRVAYGLGWAAVLLACWHNLAFTYRETDGLRGYGGSSGQNHPDLGKFLTRHSRAGELVAFQDMGATPYHAPDLRFLDIIGLVDRDVALLLQRYRVHPFVGATRARRGGEFCAALRRYVLGRRPEWIVLVPFPSPDRVDEVAARFVRDDQEAVLRSSHSYENTQFDCHIYSDPQFRRRYAHVRTWQRSSVYYLSAFRRRDLWEQVPPGVVLEARPRAVGPAASFGNGVELLGGRVERDVVPERHEVFVTTWWRLPGPRSEDTLFFVHLTRTSGRPYRASDDHVPGDWMYPATRWREGDLLEDRVLFQLPVGMPAGRYDVHVGIFDRRTGERARIVASDSSTSDDRVLVGSLTVRHARELLDRLIARTDPSEQRAGGGRRGPAAGRAQGGD